MASEGKAGAAVLGAGAGAALTYLLTKAPKVGAETLPGVNGDNLQALIGILQGIVEQNEKLDGMLAAINNLTVALGGQVSLENPEKIVAGQVLCPTVGQAEQLPPYAVPWDKELVIKALPTNVGTILVGPTQVAAQNAVSSYPLIANEAIAYKVLNADKIWVSPTVAGEGIAFTVEQK